MPIRDSIALQFERWNLSKIVDESNSHIFTPSLLPQKFFSQFSYLCSQYSDFTHGTNQWEQQLIPHWKRFLDDIFQSQTDVRSYYMISVSLEIIKAYKNHDAKGGNSGWIDLCEWAVLKIFDATRQNKDERFVGIAINIYENLYIQPLHTYYLENAGHLSINNSLDFSRTTSFLNPVGDIETAGKAMWHSARLGILSLAYTELHRTNEKMTTQELEEAIEVSKIHSEWLIGMLNANSSALRPYLDIHHIQLFLVWVSLLLGSKSENIYNWLSSLTSLLATRRLGLCSIPFISTSNSSELVFEAAVSKEDKSELTISSSCYLLVMLELVASLPVGSCSNEDKEALIKKVYNELVLGLFHDQGDHESENKPITILTWCPPENWNENILSKSLSNEGKSVLFSKELNAEEDLITSVIDFAKRSNEEHNYELPSKAPPSVITLACLKHNTPLPPKIWRMFTLRKDKQEDQNE